MLDYDYFSCMRPLKGCGDVPWMLYFSEDFEESFLNVMGLIIENTKISDNDTQTLKPLNHLWAKGLTSL